MGSSPFAVASESPSALKGRWEDMRRTAEEAWDEFEQARQKAVEAGQVKVAESALAGLKVKLDAYEVAKQAQDAAFREYEKVLEVERIGAEQAGPLSSITDAFLKGVGGSIEAFAKAVTAGVVIPAAFDPQIRRMPQRSLFIQSVMPTVETTSGVYEYVRTITNINAATAVSAGGLKPTSTITAERVQVTPTVIATVTEAVDRSLLADFDSLRRWLDETLRMNVLLAVEEQLLSGSGASPNLRGILNTVGIGSVARGTDTQLDAIEQAITATRLAFFEPDAIVLHPSDYSTIRRAKDSAGQYLVADAPDAEPPTLFGKEVITSPVMPQAPAWSARLQSAPSRSSARASWSSSPRPA